jgi:hypothetical protein
LKLPLQRYITHPKISQIAVAEQKRKICSHLTIRVVKEPQWENDSGSFSKSFLLVHVALILYYQDAGVWNQYAHWCGLVYGSQYAR